ncbi:MAG: hypothetical protein A2X61_13650 [Ignavibacteria bacterium GWB2_35_12]|nr:MAG: hypothetical protein A2X61_13650 [Ignavibacteria bacterium GWB2_35_12]OGU95197.1 MAG: hypothetical protein A2220_00265 [Ignavibacteria bacterium RIFOXYA2_FULL_35_10]OGV24511.1 MAG: hypothetical protein A2475_15510 [Ignavibacteria bacterium RIFOXYC2_FULL_35_21]
MGLKNYYTGKRASGTTLYDLAGSSNGTLGGSNLPSINTNGYLSFSGGHGSTAGNWQRVNFVNTDFQYSWNSSFSFAILFRSRKNDSTAHYLFCIAEHSQNGIVSIRLDGSNGIDILLLSSSGAYKRYMPGTNICDGNWHLVVAAYSQNSLNVYVDGKPVSLTTDNAISSGNFYPVSNGKALFGALWQQSSSNYIYDCTSDIGSFYNFNHKLSAAEVVNLNAFLKGMF